MRPTLLIQAAKIALATCCLIAPGALHAQATDPPPIVAHNTNIARLRWLEYAMVAGRVVTSGKNMNFGPSNIGGRQRERLEIHVNQGDVELSYELNSPDEQLSITLGDDRQLMVRRVRTEPRYLLDFQQLPNQPLALRVESGEFERSVHADSFWHLWLAEPDLTRRHLVPLLEMLRASWQLAAMGTALEDSLVQRGSNLKPADQGRWLQLVDELGSAQFGARENAQRELYKSGQAVLPFLEQLDRRHLDAEQLSRIRALVDALSAGYEDTTDRVVTWLAGDPHVWLPLLDREELVKRRVAAAQLSRLLGARIDFDPAADAATRREQYARLRKRLVPTSPESTAASESAAAGDRDP